MPIQAPGIGSNLDVNAIVAQLMQVERRPLTLLAREAERYTTRTTAYGTLKTSLAAFQAALETLQTGAGLRAMKASVTDPALATASAASGALESSYALEVTALAQQHKLKSGLFATTLDAVGTGTLTFQYGTYDAGTNSFTLNPAAATQTLSIGAGQGTLAGIRAAVNAAGLDVTASIVNDGSGERLVFASRSSGAARSLRITVADDDGNATDAAGLSQLAYDPVAAAGSGKNLAETAAALDASFKIDGIAITKSSNTVSDAIAGVTLNLLKAAPGTTTTLSIVQDRQAVSDSVDSLVKAYNALHATFATLTGYNAATGKGGTLQGDSAALGLHARVRALLASAVATGGTLTTLSQIGVAFQSDGKLKLDQARLDGALAQNSGDIAALFANLGRPSDSRVAWLAGSAATQTGTYAVNVTQAATHGALAGSAAAGLTVSAGVNDQIAFTVDGTSANIVLAAGTYASAAALALEVQSRLNGALAASGKAVTVAASGGVLTRATASWGTSSTVAVAAGAGATSLLGAASTASAGLDAAGSLNGAPATGNGQTLLAAVGNAAEGLQVRIQSAATGAMGTVAYSRGIAAQLDQLIDGALLSEGTIAARIAGLDSSLKTNSRRQAQFEERMVGVEKRLRAQFTALDQLMARMSATSAYLQQQLANLPKMGQ